MLKYGYWSQKRIKEFYDNVVNWNGEGVYWAKKEDFITLEDGTMTIKDLHKSDYEKIKDEELYISPKRDYEYGKHFRYLIRPKKKVYNRPYKCKQWFVNILSFKHDYMQYHANHNSWDFFDEFVISDWSSSTAFVKTTKALKRLILKWKLPVGTIVRVTGRYEFETHEFIVTK